MISRITVIQEITRITVIQEITHITVIQEITRITVVQEIDPPRRQCGPCPPALQARVALRDRSRGTRAQKGT